MSYCLTSLGQPFQSPSPSALASRPSPLGAITTPSAWPRSAKPILTTIERHARRMRGGSKN